MCWGRQGVFLVNFLLQDSTIKADVHYVIQNMWSLSSGCAHSRQNVALSSTSSRDFWLETTQLFNSPLPSQAIFIFSNIWNPFLLAGNSTKTMITNKPLTCGLNHKAKGTYLLWTDKTPVVSIMMKTMLKSSVKCVYQIAIKMVWRYVFIFL